MSKKLQAHCKYRDLIGKMSSYVLSITISSMVAVPYARGASFGGNQSPFSIGINLKFTNFLSETSNRRMGKNVKSDELYAPFISYCVYERLTVGTAVELHTQKVVTEESPTQGVTNSDESVGRTNALIPFIRLRVSNIIFIEVGYGAVRGEYYEKSKFVSSSGSTIPRLIEERILRSDSFTGRQQNYSMGFQAPLTDSFSALFSVRHKVLKGDGDSMTRIGDEQVTDAAATNSSSTDLILGMSYYFQ